MDENHRRAMSIFNPNILYRAKVAKDKNLSLVQYTSADAGKSILINKEVWLRNVQCMNDYREVIHGIDCLVNVFRNDKEGAQFQKLIEELLPGAIDKVVKLFDSWIPYLRESTHIACVSEHPKDEDLYGRLSMWRAYGGKRPIAIVMNPEAFRSESDVLAAYTYPVEYMDTDNFKQQFDALTKRIKDGSDFIKELGVDQVVAYLFELFKNYALCLKHPGFKEEREWRVVYNPQLEPSDYIQSSIESIDGVPQEVHKIPLKNIPEHGLLNVEIPELIERIIIGPTDQQLVIGHTFVKLLTEAGCDDAIERVHYSGISLR